jgi:hypothetical protein
LNRLDVEKLLEMGVAPGPQYRDLKRGIDLVLESGKRVCDQQQQRQQHC